MNIFPTIKEHKYFPPREGCSSEAVLDKYKVPWAINIHFDLNWVSLLKLGEASLSQFE